jgi:hypothetical protein
MLVHWLVHAVDIHHLSPQRRVSVRRRASPDFISRVIRVRARALAIITCYTQAVRSSGKHAVELPTGLPHCAMSGL